MPHRILVVMRHAQAESSAATDLERPLSGQGRDDAVAAGRWLAEHALRPQHAIVSAATRTRETWAGVSRGGGWSLDAEISGALYEAGVDSALEQIRLVDDAVGTVLVLGHNPTMAALAQLVDDDEGDLDATNRMAVGSFPPCAVAVLAVSGPWDDLGPGRGRLTSYHVARG